MNDRPSHYIHISYTQYSLLLLVSLLLLPFLLLPTQHRYTPKYSLSETYAFRNDDDEWVTGEMEQGVKQPWLPFVDARDFVRTLKLKSQADWEAYCKSGKRPVNIPSTPRRTYGGDKGFVSFPDWMGCVFLFNVIGMRYICVRTFP